MNVSDFLMPNVPSYVLSLELRMLSKVLDFPGMKKLVRTLLTSTASSRKEKENGTNSYLRHVSQY
jgi:hypothetical protein